MKVKQNKTGAAYWIKTLKLKPHPEGGFFREIYRSAERIPSAALPARYRGTRTFSTSIYFLLAGTQISALHRLASDEQWYFYDGNTLHLTMIAPDGTLKSTRLGRHANAGEQLQVVIPAKTWMGARLTDHGGYALIGCTVAPGFEFQDFEMGQRADLLARYPRRRKLILALTRSCSLA